MLKEPPINDKKIIYFVSSFEQQYISTMKLTYIYHSCYAIESDNFVIIFDFYKDLSGKGIIEQLLTTDKSLYVLSSHSHYDHFVRQILKWRDQRADIKYIFSYDILENGMAKKEDAIFLNKLDTYKDDILEIKAYGSTDLGISFLIKAEGKTIFHAGDLNNWHWSEESTAEEINEAEKFYLSELNTLANDVKHINLAMFPIDPRLGKDYMKGAQQFVDTIKTDIFAPMHFGGAYAKANAFAEYAQSKGVKFTAWKEKGESIHI